MVPPYFLFFIFLKAKQTETDSCGCVIQENCWPLWQWLANRVPSFGANAYKPQCHRPHRENSLWTSGRVTWYQKNSYNRVYIINSSFVLFSQLSSESRLHPECNTAHFMCAITVFKWTAAHSTEARSGDTAASHGHKHTFIALSCTVSQGFGISVESGRGSVNRVETENVHLLNAIKKPLCSMTHYVSHKLTYSEDPAFCRHT